MSNQIKIKPHFQYIDYLLEILGVVGILFMIIIVSRFWSDLPESIPIHYNARGEPDGYGAKIVICLLPAIAVLIYAGLTILIRYPYIFNYPVKVTDDNAKRMYTLGTRTIRIIKVMIIILFAFINYRSVKISLGDDEGLGSFMLPVFMIAMAIIIGFMIFKMFRSRNRR